MYIQNGHNYLWTEHNGRSSESNFNNTYTFPKIIAYLLTWINACRQIFFDVIKQIGLENMLDLKSQPKS
jgi:hypothetical protein